MTRASDTLVAWHAHRAGIDVLRNAITNLKRDHGIAIRRAILLDQTDGTGARSPGIQGIELERVPVDLRDPTHHPTIYEEVRAFARARLKSAVHVNISPGTPAMHAVWLTLYAAGALPPGTRLWSSQRRKDDSTSIEEVAFSLTTYLAEIRRVQGKAPKVAQYDLEAKSPLRRGAFERLARYARLPRAPLLIIGERGTGKSRLVESVVGTLKQREVAVVPCGTLDSALADSLLFGHEKGAFTGATSERKGLLRSSDGGVLFLDEVQDLPSTAQRRLVRFLQDGRGRFRPLGGDAEVEADVEVVCASNLPLATLRDRLDRDLFDRLAHLIVEVPPLRDCRADLEDDWARVWHELRASPDLPADAPNSPAVRALLRDHPLPGNLRDLQRLAYLLAAWSHDRSPDDAIDVALADWYRAGDPLNPAPMASPQGTGTRAERLRDFQRRLALSAKAEHGTWKAAAKALGCDEKTLRDDARDGRSPVYEGSSG